MTTSTYRSDVVLENVINQKLISEPYLDESKIHIFIKNGKVVLRGTVNSDWEQCVAEFAIKSTEGVKEVIDDLDILDREDIDENYERTDADIKNAVITALYWDENVPNHGIHVKVKRGWVTLTGKVNNEHQRYSAENTIRKITVVKNIHNLIKVSSI